MVQTQLLVQFIIKQEHEATFLNLLQISEISVVSNMLIQWRMEEKIKKYDKIVKRLEIFIGERKELQQKCTKTHKAFARKKGGPFCKSINFYSDTKRTSGKVIFLAKK